MPAGNTRGILEFVTLFVDRNIRTFDVATKVLMYTLVTQKCNVAPSPNTSCVYPLNKHICRYFSYFDSMSYNHRRILSFFSMKMRVSVFYIKN